MHDESIEKTISFLKEKALSENRIIYKDEILAILNTDFPDIEPTVCESYIKEIIDYFEFQEKDEIKVVDEVNLVSSSDTAEPEYELTYDSIERSYINYLISLPRLDKKEEVELIAAFKNPNLDQAHRNAARNIIIEKHMYICCFIAHRNRSSFDILDLIHEGFLGLVTALEKFDLSRDIRFSTYAVWFVKARIMNYISSNQHIKCPAYLSYTISQIYKIRDSFYAEHGKYPSISELTELSNIPKSQIYSAILYIKEPVYFDEEMNNNDGHSSTKAEIISDPQALSVEEQVDYKMLRELIESILKKISDRDRFILMQHIGINNENKRMTFEEISKIIAPHNIKKGKPRKLSRERCRQLERLIVNQIRNSEYAELLKEYWEESENI